MIFELRRKIQELIPNGTRYITLDKRWMDYKEIKKGQMMVCIYAGEIIVLIPENSPVATQDILKQFKSELMKW